MMKAQKERKQAWSAAYWEAKEHGGARIPPLNLSPHMRRKRRGKNSYSPVSPINNTSPHSMTSLVSRQELQSMSTIEKN
jgi:hypothetical protein